MRHRYELVSEATQRKNKLTSICDELFPELTQVFKNPNLPTALDLREQFSTPSAVASAPLTALREVRKKNFPSEAQLVRLQQLAASSIGTKEPGRLRGLTLEQSLLIKELRLIQDTHVGLCEPESKTGPGGCRNHALLRWREDPFR